MATPSWRCLIGCHGEVEDGLGDGAVQPCANAAVVLGPSLINRFGSRGPIDVLEESKLAAHGMEEGAPLGVVRRMKLQGYVDVSLHVDGRKGADHISHGRRRNSGGGAGDLEHQLIGSVEEGRAQPREGGAGGGVAGAQVGRREGGETP